MTYPTQEQIDEARRVLAAVEAQEIQARRDNQAKLAALVQSLKETLQNIRNLRDATGIDVNLAEVVDDINRTDDVNDYFEPQDWNSSGC